MIRLAVCFWLIATAALAEEVDPSLCRDIDDTTRALVPADLHVWYKIPHAIKACPVYLKNDRLLWRIITLDENSIGWKWDNDLELFPFNVDGITRRNTPRPYIIDGKAREVGRLSACFPSCGEPSHTDLILSQWVNGFPHRITIKVFNARVMGDYVAPPLQWNAKTRYYDQIGKGQYDMPPTRKQSNYTKRQLKH